MKRKEDPRFTAARAGTSTISAAGMLYMDIVRSPTRTPGSRKIDTSKALKIRVCSR